MNKNAVMIVGAGLILLYTVYCSNFVSCIILFVHAISCIFLCNFSSFSIMK